ncbi:trehalose-phosphatase [Sciscionella marina]|uniref:trehalose-phosphatase n=1 Tax=Sciscionella marina TaxID=508770 RepID=UPI00036CB88A|nr:trehalose-phosphatase [Sciscionella marina]
MSSATVTHLGLDGALRRAARVDRLLVATAFDGTLTPHKGAAPDRRALEALCALADVRHTAAAVISGRALRDLALASRLPFPVALIGSHGAETGPNLERELAPASRGRLERLAEEARSLVAATPGAEFERKPAGVVVHLRGVDAAGSRWVRERMRGGLGLREGVRVIDGAEVVELTVATQDKGDALEGLRTDFGADAVVYFGDDEPDEAAFARCGDRDVTVRVGEGESAAAYRVPDGAAVTEALRTLLVARG